MVEYLPAVDGPWLREPDQKVFMHRGLPCCMLRHESVGHWCGYVGVPRGHLLWGAEYGEPFEELKPWIEARYRHQINPASLGFRTMIDILFSGELETSPENALVVHGGLSWTRDYRPDQAPDGFWWFGFDCGHAGDLSPRMLSIFGSDYGTYRDRFYVEGWTRCLAQQLAGIRRPSWVRRGLCVARRKTRELNFAVLRSLRRFANRRK